MKKILIATDFSVAADDAARYAIELAIKLKSDVILINAAPVSTDSPVEVLWPIEDYQTLIKRTDIRLKDLSKTLLESIPVTESSEALPKISIKSDLSSVSDLLRETVQKENIGFAVMGLSGAGNMKRFILGSSSRDVIDSADYPVLLIPKGTAFKPIRKIAFATDLVLNDMDSIQILASFASLLNAELIIVHVIGRNIDKDLTGRIDAFMGELKKRINYERIYFENVYRVKVEDGLDWLKDHGEMDLLVMIHRKHGIMNDFVNGSHAQKMARQTKLPLLVMPEGYLEMLC
ncbi:universal stress protein [Pedobacter fastidiosus]|uniref:Universal stress protein n=1 Tax=Pedobacter fastidiosus TaxID=2765361 RepID=A0ABR7KS75_9SPHI|nr:universal stress protein [Pedobacter fastidiosus]MBC6110954.1 universal stress protein [Pedobacter fastidiosus]